MKFEVKTEEADVVSVHTTYGRLKFKNVDQEKAKELYATAMGMTPERLTELKPTVKLEKVVRPCLVTSESTSSETSLKKQQKQQSDPSAKTS